MNFGAQVRKIRTKAKMSQREMADKLKICQGTLSRLERNDLPPTTHTLKNLRKEFKFNVNKFLDQQR